MPLAWSINFRWPDGARDCEATAVDAANGEVLTYVTLLAGAGNETTTRLIGWAGVLLAANPDHPVVFYHLACVEARAGREEDALAHIRRAVELHPELAERVRDDENLAGLTGRLGVSGKP